MNLQEPEIRVRDSRAVRAALKTIQDRHPDKLLVPEKVVEEAADEASPLHSYFDWDDSEAARQWRMMQARALIRKIEVIYPDDRSESAVPKYVSLRSDRKKPGGGYRETGSVLSSRKLLGELEETAKKDIEGVLRRYEMLKNLCKRVRRALK